MKIKTGILGGTFNPIHLGHLVLANYLCEFEGLDEVWFLVTPQNPLRSDTPSLDDETRLELVKLATEEFPHFVASDFEFHLPKPSYTYLTLAELKKSYPEREFTLIIGADNWLIFDRWKESQHLIEENSIMVYPRPSYDVPENSLPKNVRLVHSPIIEISSTFIRKAIREGKDIRYFLHPAVYCKIREKKYYL